MRHYIIILPRNWAKEAELAPLNGAAPTPLPETDGGRAAKRTTLLFLLLRVSPLHRQRCGGRNVKKKKKKVANVKNPAATSVTSTGASSSRSPAHHHRHQEAESLRVPNARWPIRLELDDVSLELLTL